MSITSGTVLLFFVAAALLLISLGFAIPMGISASHRQMNPIGWGTLGFFTWLLGLVLYLLFLQPICTDVKCPSCGNLIPEKHIYCPYCGRKEN